MTRQIERINPDGLMKNPAFSQVVTTQGNGKTIYIGGQNAVNKNREFVGKGDIQAQTEQVMQNIQVALESCGATFDNLVKLSIHIVQGQNLYGAFQISQRCSVSCLCTMSTAILSSNIQRETGLK